MSDVLAPPPPPHPAYGGDGPTGPRAEFFRRFLATLIDLVIVTIVPAIVYVFVRPLGVLLWAVSDLAYFTYFEGSRSGQTIAKRLVGIRVIDFSTGGPIGYARAFVRNIGRFPSSFLCFLGFFWMLWDREKQTWHDLLANDVVVPVDAYPVASWPN